jgi:exopolyphosphatase/guanosine-5'-triphosphate,3'-diphosphate pyrophosphatase
VESVGAPGSQGDPVLPSVTAARVAAIDLGSNSTRLLVADVQDGNIAELERLLRITRLGDGVDGSGRLADDAIGRVSHVVDAYVERARDLAATRILAVATSAVRDAGNGRDFLAALANRHGIAWRILSGDEEAAMTFRGVTSRSAPSAETLICDIGGGSTELVLGGPDGVADQISLNIGCVRMSERHLASDPPTAEEVAGLRAATREALPALTRGARVLIGVAGTVTTLATIDRGLEQEIPEEIDGHRLTTEAVERMLGELAALPLAARRQVRGLMPERALTIVAGAAILAEVLRATSLPHLTVSERDILHGAVLAAAA